MTKEKFDRLRGIEDKELVCHVIHSDSGDIEAERGEESLTEGQLTAYCVEVFFGLTCNGGYQSLVNGAYEWTVPHSAASLRRVGLSDYADDFDDAIKNWFPTGIPDDPDAYCDRIDQLYEDFEDSPDAKNFSDPFEVYEDGFWKRYQKDETEFRRLLHAYIVANEDAFITNQGEQDVDPNA